jgi:hypothetical protein
MLTEKKFQEIIIKKLESIETRLTKIENEIGLTADDEKPKKKKTSKKKNARITYYPEESQLKKAKLLNLENVKQYFDYMIAHSKDGCSMGYKKISEEVDITQGEALRIFKKLIELKYLERDSTRTTKILKKSLDLKDFENK